MTKASQTSGGAPHEPRLTQALRALLNSQRVAALGTLGADGHPFVSMVPFAIDNRSGTVVIHVSGLAPHTRNLQASPKVSLMVMQTEVAGEPVHALSRVTLEGTAAVIPPDSPMWHSARTAYLQRFPEAEPMTQLGDFRFVDIDMENAHQVAGFGAARTLDADALAQVMRPSA
jgi:putative heme iron utilization protein